MKNRSTSVIIPVYNEEEYLESSLDSILNQTLQPEKIILVDDGSTDGSPEIIAQYSREHNHINIVHSNGPHGSVGPARNVGVDHADSKYIAFQDADDWSEPKRLETQFKYLQNNEKVDILGTNLLRHLPGEKEPIKNRFFDWNNSELLLKKIYQVSPIPQATTMMKRNVFLDLGGYRDQNHSTDDADFWIRVFLNGYQVDKIQEPMYHYREKPSKYDSMKGRAIVSKIELLLPEHYEGERSLAIWGTGDAGELLFKGMEKARNLGLTEFSLDYVVESQFSRNPRDEATWTDRGLPVKQPEQLGGDSFFIGGSYVSFNDMQNELREHGHEEYEDFEFFV